MERFVDKMCLFLSCFFFDIPGSFRNSWCGIVFQLLVAFEEPKIKMVKFWKTRRHSPQSSCDRLKQSPDLPQG